MCFLFAVDLKVGVELTLLHDVIHDHDHSQRDVNVVQLEYYMHMYMYSDAAFYEMCSCDVIIDL